MRIRRKDALRSVVLGCAMGMMPQWASGQTWVSPTSGFWSNPSNWSAVPVSGSSTSLIFPSSGSQTYLATDDLGGPFVLRGISFNGTSTEPVTVASGTLSSFRFAGITPFISNTSVGPVSVTGRASLTNTVTISTGGATSNATAIEASVLGGGGIVVSNAGSGAVALSSGNTFTGGVTLNSGKLELGSQRSLGTGVLNANGGVLATSMAIAPLGRPPFRPIFSNSIVTSGSGLALGGKNGFSLDGPISGSGGVTLSPTNDLNATWTLAGTNTFTGPLTINSSPTPLVSSTLIINSAASLGNPSAINLNGGGLAFVAASSPITINKPLTLGAAGGFLGAHSLTTNAEVTYSGSITGSGALTRTHGGFLTLSGANTFTGTLTLAAGTTIASAANLGNSALVFSGGSLVMNPAFGSYNREVRIEQSGSTIYVLGTASFNGISSGALPVSYTKSGAGNLNILAASTFVGNISVDGGTLTADGGTGRLNNGAGTLAINQAGAVVINNGGSVTTRLNAATTVNVSGGTLRLIGNSSVNSTLSTSGAVFVGSPTQSGAGYSIFSISPGAGANAAMQFGGIARAANNGSMVLFTGNGLGANSIVSATPGTSNISLTVLPTLTNGILPYAIADASGGAGTDFATYSGTNGIQPLTTYSPNLTSGATTNAAVGNAASAAGGSTINSLKLLGGTVDASTGLTVSSGAILCTGAANISGGTLNLGTVGTLTGNIFALADLNISSRIVTLVPFGSTQPSGIAKAGAGVLTLSGLQDFVGPTRVLQGTLRAGAANSLPNTTEVFISPGATFDLNGFNTTIGSLNQTETPNMIGNNPHGTLNVGAASLTFGGDNLSTTVNIAINGNGNLIKTGSGSFSIIGNQAFTGTFTIASGALVLGTHLTDGTALRNATRINLGSSTISGDAVLEFDFGLKDGFSVPILTQAQSGRTATIKFSDAPAGTPGVVLASPVQINTSRGVIIDSSGGMTMSGIISGAGPLITTTSDDSLAAGPDGFALNLTGVNTYTGATTLAAVSTLWGNPSAFGNSATPIGLGDPNGPDNPEMSSSAGGLVFTRNITLNDSLNAVAQFGIIGSRAPAGSGTTTYSGNISIAGMRNRLVLYSRNAPVSFTGVISGLLPDANVQIGASAGPGLEWIASDVTLSGANTYAGGTQIITGTLNLGSNTVVSGGTITSGPLGTGPVTIGSSATIGATAEPTLIVLNAPRTLANPITLANNFAISGPNSLTFTGGVDLGGSARIITVNSPAATFSGVVSGAFGSALIKDGTGILTLLSSNSYGGPAVVAGGTLILTASQQFGGNFTVANGATANLTSGGSKVLLTSILAVEAATGSRLDLTDNKMIVDYGGGTPIAQISSLVGSAFNSGAWNGPGITSTIAATNTSHAIGVVEAGALGITTFAGGAIDSTAILLGYTRFGDTDLNGIVNLVDFNRLASNFGFTGRYWYQADFNYDGVVNLIDFNYLAANFGLSASAEGPTPQDWANLAAAIPEPTSTLLLTGVVASAAMSSRRRRTR